MIVYRYDKDGLRGKLLFDQTGDHGSCPETEIQTVLAGIFAIYPGKHLLLLARRQRARMPGCGP